MTIQDLESLLASGAFHHATYRDIGTLWEGWHIYCKQNNGFNGFTHAGMFAKDNPDAARAYELVRATGYSVGAYGQG